LPAKGLQPAAPTVRTCAVRGGGAVLSSRTLEHFFYLWGPFTASVHISLGTAGPAPREEWLSSPWGRAMSLPGVGLYPAVHSVPLSLVYFLSLVKQSPHHPPNTLPEHSGTNQTWALTVTALQSPNLSGALSHPAPAWQQWTPPPSPPCLGSHLSAPLSLVPESQGMGLFKYPFFCTIFSI
jgi:hypothetical protein